MNKNEFIIKLSEKIFLREAEKYGFLDNGIQSIADASVIAAESLYNELDVYFEVNKMVFTGTVDELEEEYQEWAKGQSSPGYGYGWHRGHVFQFLREKCQ